jgi:hypothetical protein
MVRGKIIPPAKIYLHDLSYQHSQPLQFPLFLLLCVSV